MIPSVAHFSTEICIFVWVQSDVSRAARKTFIRRNAFIIQNNGTNHLSVLTNYVFLIKNFGVWFNVSTQNIPYVLLTHTLSLVRTKFPTLSTARAYVRRIGGYAQITTTAVIQFALTNNYKSKICVEFFTWFVNWLQSLRIGHWALHSFKTWKYKIYALFLNQIIGNVTFF